MRRLAAATLCLLACSCSPKTPSSDRGVVQFLLEVDTQGADSARAETLLHQTVNRLEHRVRGLGFRNAFVERVAGGRVQVQLPVVDQPSLEFALTTSSHLRFQLVAPRESLAAALAGGWSAASQARPGSDRSALLALLASPSSGDAATCVPRMLAGEAEGLLAGEFIDDEQPSRALFAWSADTAGACRDLLLLEPEDNLPARFIANAEARIGTDEEDPSRWGINLQLTQEGAREFAEVTRRFVGRRLAVVMFGKVLVAPMIAEEIRGGDITIHSQLSDTRAGAMGLASWFTTPDLPAPLRVVSKETLSPRTK